MLLSPLSVAEVHQTVADMGDFKATDAFGIKIDALKVVLAHAPTADLITALL